MLTALYRTEFHVLKVAMIFEACRSIQADSRNLEIQKHTMKLAIEHIEECLKASSRLEGICRKAYIENDAEWLLARIRNDFRLLAKDGSIILSRTEITSKYANHGHRGAQNVRHIYTHLIPELISQGQATLLQKDGKLERYAFRAS